MEPYLRMLEKAVYMMITPVLASLRALSELTIWVLSALKL